MRLAVTDDAGVTGSSTQSVTVSGAPTTPAFTYSRAGTECRFTDASLTPNAIRQWSWSFGDGTTPSVQNPSHSYAAAGTYSVRLDVTGGQGGKFLEHAQRHRRAGRDHAHCDALQGRVGRLHCVHFRRFQRPTGTRRMRARRRERVDQEGATGGAPVRPWSAERRPDRTVNGSGSLLDSELVTLGVQASGVRIPPANVTRTSG